MADQAPILVHSETGWTSFRIEAVPSALHPEKSAGRYLVRPYQAKEWIEVTRETYLAALATAQYDRTGLSLESIDADLRRRA